MLWSSLAFIGGSVSNVALCSIERSFGGSAADLQRTINAYALPLSALLLLGSADNEDVVQIEDVVHISLCRMETGRASRLTYGFTPKDVAVGL